MRRKKPARGRVKKYSRDFSNKTVVVMLILVITVSIISLGFYMTAIHDQKLAAQEETSPVDTQGAVTLQITSPPKQENPNTKIEENNR